MVQETGLQMLMMLDAKSQTQHWLDDLKSRVASSYIVSGDREGLRSLFPEWDKEADQEGEFEKARDGDDYDIDRVDGSKLVWSVPEPDKRADLDRWIAEHSAGQVSGSELDGKGWM